MTRPRKIIFIHQRPYPYTEKFYDEGSEHYFYFGMGTLLLDQLKRETPYAFELWRGEIGTDRIRERRVNGYRCRIFPQKYYRVGSTISVPMIREIGAEKRSNDVLVHFTASPHARELHLLALRHRDIPVAASHQGGAHPLWFFQEEGSWRSYASYLFERIALPRCDAFFAFVEEEREYLARMTDASRVIGGPNFGMDLEHLAPLPKRDAKQRLGIDPNAKMIFLAGTLSHYRGGRDAIDVFNRLKQEFNVVFVNVGASPADAEYAWALDQGVMLRGRVSHDELPVYFSAADVYLYLTSGKQNLAFAGTGMAPLEALACNTPVVGNTLHHIPNGDGARVGVIASTIDEACDGVRAIFQAPERFQPTRWVVEKYFAWDAIVDAHLATYERLFMKYYGPRTP